MLDRIGSMPQQLEWNFEVVDLFPVGFSEPKYG
jgi:hypothetical protein